MRRGLSISGHARVVGDEGAVVRIRENRGRGAESYLHSRETSRLPSSTSIAEKLDVLGRRVRHLEGGYSVGIGHGRHGGDGGMPGALVQSDCLAGHGVAKVVVERDGHRRGGDRRRSPRSGGGDARLGTVHRAGDEGDRMGHRGGDDQLLRSCRPP